MIEALHYDFVQRALLAGLLASIACGIIGTYVVVKRIVFVSDGISHASLGGLGIATWLGVPPLYGAVAFSLLAAFVLGLASLRHREQEDTLIGALWVTGMAIGILFIAATPGYASDLTGYLFGNILLVSIRDLQMTLLLDILIIVVVWRFYKEFLAISFDDEFSALRGLPTAALYILLLCLVALTIIVMIRVVGIVLVIALLTIPPAISRWFTHRVSAMMLLSCFLGALFAVLGLIVSYYTDFPSGACIALTAATAFIITLTLRRLFT